MTRDPEIPMKVAAKRVVAEDVVALELEPVDAPQGLADWTPGSHVDLVSPDGLVRQYSLCGPAGQPKSWQVAVLRAADGRGGSAWVHDDLVEGDEVVVRGPRNHFRLEKSQDYLFIAGGIGITPILAMIREVERRGGVWRLAYGGRSRASMAFLDELEGLGDRVTVIPQDEHGLLDLDVVLGDPRPGRLVYCCGPEPLLEALEQRMADRPERLHLERFSPKGELDTSGDAFEVEIASSGKKVTVDEGQSIIDALQAVGLYVDFSCREGTCGTCETGVLAGVPDHRDSILDDEDRAANDCMMICVGRCLQGPLMLDL